MNTVHFVIYKRVNNSCLVFFLFLKFGFFSNASELWRCVVIECADTRPNLDVISGAIWSPQAPVFHLFLLIHHVAATTHHRLIGWPARSTKLPVEAGSQLSLWRLEKFPLSNGSVYLSCDYGRVGQSAKPLHRVERFDLTRGSIRAATKRRIK